MRSFLLIFCISLNLYGFEFPKNFDFGVASAPAHVEDDLHDPWLEFAKAGSVKAFYNTPLPEMRVAFWTQPEKEIELLDELNVDIYRLGISWSRLVPTYPFKDLDQKSIEQYKKIFKKIKEKKIKIMLTLFHHSMPDWAHKLGGFSNEKVRKAFLQFSILAYEEFSPYVDIWLTFNEPNVYSFMTHVQGLWPYGSKSMLSTLNFPFYKGRYFKELDGMISSHNEVYKNLKSKNQNLKISIAQNFASYQGEGFVGSFMQSWAIDNMNYYFIDGVKENLDFLGINYYGAEFFKNAKLIFHPDYLYSEAGRAISPLGFFNILKEAYQRYELPIYITENGVADRTDVFRPPYLVEHLKAIHQATEEGVEVLGYIHWTLSDNWEWADGYCPRFGLVAVDRLNDFYRIKRPSFNLFKTIIKNHGVSDTLYKKVWRTFLEDKTENYYLCRDESQEVALDEPRLFPLKNKAWALE